MEDPAKTGTSEKNGDRRRWNRRVKAGIVYFLALEASFYICVAGQIGLELFEVHARYLTAGLFFVVTGLTMTDVFFSRGKQ